MHNLPEHIELEFLYEAHVDLAPPERVGASPFGLRNIFIVTGGVLIVEPWFTPEKWNINTTHVTLVEQPEFKLVRMAYSTRRDDVAVIDFHFLVGSTQGVEHFTERHELGLYTNEQYLDAFTQAGLAVHVDVEGVNKRGLYVGVKPT